MVASSRVTGAGEFTITAWRTQDANRTDARQAAEMIAA
jgi:hypothetical protein